MPLVDEALEKTLMGWLKELVDAGLTSKDLTLAWLPCWVFPLRAREHKMCFYSGPRDPTRVSMEVLSLKEMRDWASVVITDRIGKNWKFGWRPYSREDRAPQVSFLSLVLYLPSSSLFGRLDRKSVV